MLNIRSASIRTVFILTGLATLALVFVSLNSSAHAQLAPSAPAESKSVPAVDPYGRTDPRSSVEGYIKAIRQDDFEKAARYLDLSNIEKDKRRIEGEQRAHELIQLLDRDGFINQTSKLSTLPQGDLNDELDANLEQVGMLDRSERQVPLMMHQIVGENDLKIWVFEPSMLNRVPFLLRVTQEGILDRILPEQLKTYKITNVAIGHWIGIFVAAIVSLGIGYLVSTLIIMGLRAVLRKRSDLPGHNILASIRIPLAVVMGVSIYRAAVIFLGIQVVARDYINWVATIASLLALMWLGMRIVDGISEFVRYGMSRTNRITSVAVVMLARRMAKAVVMVIIGITILDIVGVDVTTGLAALGIGGLALALGAQKTIENLVGSITVVADKPVRVGDFCKFGTVTGTVEDIGIRSTQVRTLDRTIVTVPNGAFSAMEIENYSVRDQFKLQTTLGMRYETTPDQIRYLLVEIRKLLDDHPHVLPDPLRVRFVSFNSSSVDLEIFGYVKAASYAEFLEVQEFLFLQIMEVVYDSGTQFAFPSQTLYFGKDGPPQAKDAEKIGKLVRKLDADGELPLPKFEKPEEPEPASKTTKSRAKKK